MAGGMHITGGSWAGQYGHSTSFTGGGQEKTMYSPMQTLITLITLMIT